MLLFKGRKQKKLMKKKQYTYIILACAAIILIAFSWWGYSQLSIQEKQADINLYTLVPADCEAILETNDLNALYKTIHNSNYVQQYNLLKVSDLVNLLTDNIETLSRQQAHGLSTEMNRQLLVSFHQPGSVRDQVIYGRFGNGDINSIYKLMQKSIKSTHTPKKLAYRGEEIIIYPIGKDFLACYVQPGFFAVSFQEKLIERVIDAYQQEKSVSKDNHFNTLRKQSKHNDQLSLFIHSDRGNHPWKHYEIRMNASAIYLTSNQAVADTTNYQADKESLIERTDGTHLPQLIQLMAQIPFRKEVREDSIPTSATTLENILAENGCNEINLILFSQPTMPDTIHHQLLMAAIPMQHLGKMKSQLRTPLNAKRRTSMWIQGAAYPIWVCPTDSAISHYFLPQHTGQELWLSIYKNYLLMATDKETLHNYLTEVTTSEEENPPYTLSNNKIVYQYCLGDLAEEANFTLVADLHDIITRHPDIMIDNPLIPDFFFKHGDFFKHFMLSTQFIRTSGHISSQVILTYQGDSILFKEARD